MRARWRAWRRRSWRRLFLVTDSGTLIVEVGPRGRVRWVGYDNSLLDPQWSQTCASLGVCLDHLHDGGVPCATCPVRP